MLSASALGVVCALTSAVVWGSGDFSGGLAARRSSPTQVLALSALSGVVVLVALAVLWGESLPTAGDALLAGLAGLGGAVGITALYRGLALGQAATVAPASGVISAGLPVLFAALTTGPPAPAQLVGFALAGAGLWLVSQPDGSASRAHRRAGLVLAVAAGTGFAGFFILIAEVERGIFAPLVVARMVMLAAALVLIAARRLPLPSLTAQPIALVAGVLDAGGNIFYVLARQLTRLDVAVVLASLYPAATVVLARVVLHERISPRQWLGAALCLAAVTLIAA